MRSFFPSRPSTPPPPAADGRSDAVLVEAAAKGEREAFLEIVQRYQSLVCAVAFSVVRRLEVSEEVAQEVFVTLWKHLGALREPEKLRTWLKVCARTRAIDALRRERPALAGLAPEEMDALLESLADDRRTPDDAASHADEAALVWAALDDLPESMRLPLILYYREGESAAEVARQLDMTEETVRQRLSRGRALLRDRLAGALERVLAESRPSALFTFAVLAGIGALTAPGALAATAISGGMGAAGSSAGTFFKAISISKSTLGLAAALAIVAVPLGYHVAAPQAAASALSSAGGEMDAARPGLPADVNLADSSLYHEWLALHRQFGAMPPTAAAMRPLLEAVLAIADPFRKRAFLAALIAEWVQVDPQAAMERFLKDDRDALAAVMSLWMKKDPLVALGAFAPHAGVENFVAWRLLKLIAEAAPQELPGFLSRMKPDSSDSGISNAFALVAAKDLALARTLAEELIGLQRTPALSGVAGAWARSDPAAAFAWAQSLPEGRGMAMGHVLQAWAEQDPLGALDHLYLTPSRDEDDFRAESIVLPAAAAKDFPRTLRWLAEHPDFLSGDGVSLADCRAFRDAFAADRDGIIRQIGALSGTEQDRLFKVMADIDLGYRPALAQWLQQQKPDDPLAGKIRRFVEADQCWADPAAAVRIISQKPAAVLNNPEAMAEWAAAFLPNESLENGWLPRLTDDLLDTAPPQLRAALLRRGLDVIAEEYLPGQLVDIYTRHLHELPPEDQARALTAAACTLSNADPSTAIEWLSHQPPETAANAYGGVAATWALSDPMEASVWVQTLPEGAARDHAASGLARTILQTAPDDAWVWATSIQDATIRSDVAQAVISQLAATLPDNAQTLINHAPLPEAEKANLRQLLTAPSH